MTDAASISSENYSSPSSSFYNPSPQPSASASASQKVPPVSQHRPPPLNLSAKNNDTTMPRRPQSQPVVAASGHGENGGPEAAAAAKPMLPPTPGSASYSSHYDEEHAGSRNKKRAKSIDIDEANQSSIARLSLYTPTTARNDGPRELICLCAKAPKVPRPRNGMYFSPCLPNWYWLRPFRLILSPPRHGPALSSFVGHFLISSHLGVSILPPFLSSFIISGAESRKTAAPEMTTRIIRLFVWERPFCVSKVARRMKGDET